MGDMTKNFRYRANKAIIDERCNQVQMIDQNRPNYYRQTTTVHKVPWKPFFSLSFIQNVIQKVASKSIFTTALWLIQICFPTIDG